jgi:hypothetical protein
MKYMRRTAGYIWTVYKQIHKLQRIKNNSNFGQITGKKRNCIQHVNRMPRNRLPRVMKQYSPTGRRNQGRPLKRLLDKGDRNGSTSGPTA